MKHYYHLLLGSNLGDRESYLTRGEGLLRTYGLDILRESSIYESQAWGNENQNHFLNKALLVCSHRSPGQFLNFIFMVEKLCERQRNQKWGPRTLDIDIIFHEGKVYNSQRLSIPHKEFRNRKFVLLPIKEIDGAFIDPLSGCSIKQLFDACEDPLWVRKFNE